MKTKFIFALAAGIIGLTASANAAYVNYYATWSGASYGNSASAYASFKLDTDYLSTNPFSMYVGTLPSWITDIDLTVTGAASGNGVFTSADFNGAAFYSDGPADFSQELVGQGNFYDFTLMGAYANAPGASGPFRLAVGSGQEMQLTSLSTSAVPEASTSLGLLALGAGGVLTRRRLKRAA